MAKEKKIVNITEESEKSKEKFGKDAKGNIIKLEDQGNNEQRAKTKRIFAVILWVIAIACEIIAILRLTDKISLFAQMDKTTFLIIFIILDLLFFVPGSLLWKKANHIDPISEKDKAKFWIWNNLGTILSVLAFLPIIVFVLLNKDLDKKSKTIVTAVASVALIIAGVSSYDFNPVSSEALEQAQKEVMAVNGTDTVYWAKHSKKYHVDPDCPAFSQSEEIYEGTVAQAYEHNLTEPCRRCIPELHEDHEEENDKKDN